MARLFDEHIIRPVQSLDGPWRFLTDPTDRGEKENWFLGLPEGETVIVPSVWNTEDGLLDYEGVAWYEKQFYNCGGCLRLCFDAVMTQAKIWLDGEYLGSHYGGFSQFSFILPEVAAGIHRLIVLADNRFDEHSIPQSKVDWYPYGGIIRSVTAENLRGICVLGNRMEYTLSEDMTRAQCRLVLDCYNGDKTAKTAPLTAKLDDTVCASGEITLEPGQRKEVALAPFMLENVRLWDVGKPELYRLSICSDTDDLYDRVGFRKVCVEQGKVLLNGREIEFKGVNRHEEHPDFGFAFPPCRMKYDIDLVLKLGGNAVRGAHYPNSRLFLDYLDETGILFWSEIPIWGGGFSQKALADPVVLERGLVMHREMVEEHYNHPSITFWGMHNEILVDTPEGLEMSKIYYRYLKDNGGNRLVVYATNFPMTDICYDYTDVICLNLYYGWYGDGLPDWDAFLEKFCHRRQLLGLQDKPILFSEFGGAALYGFHDVQCSKWSEEYQAKLLEYCLKLFHNHPAVAGSFIWQFCDIRTSSQMDLSRARGFNNKGILNENRRPKGAYYAVQSCWQKK